MIKQTLLNPVSLWHWEQDKTIQDAVLSLTNNWLNAILLINSIIKTIMHRASNIL